jgi:hypothetical protein
MGLCGSLMQILISHDSWPDKLSTKHKISEGQKMNIETIQGIIWSHVKYDYVKGSITNDQLNWNKKCEWKRTYYYNILY